DAGGLRLRGEGVRGDDRPSRGARAPGPRSHAAPAEDPPHGAERVRPRPPARGRRGDLAALPRGARAAPRRGQARLRAPPDAEMVSADTREPRVPRAGRRAARPATRRGRVPAGGMDGGGAARARPRVPPSERAHLRFRRRAAGYPGKCAAARRDDIRCARGRPLPRTQTSDLGPARGEHDRAVRLPLRAGGARRVGREDSRPRPAEPRGPRADEQLLPTLRGAEREGSSGVAGVALAYSPPHADGSRSTAGASFVKSTANRDESATVTPSGNRRVCPIVCGGCGWPFASNFTIDMLPQRVSSVTGSRFSSA